MNKDINNPQDGSEKYASFLWWASFVLTLILYLSSFIATVVCYIPYSFDGAVAYDVRIAIFTLIAACSVLIVFSMLLSHILKKKLSDIAMIGIFAVGCILVAAPRIYKMMEWREASYAISGYLFFMIPLSLLFIFSSFTKEKRSAILGYFTVIISALVMTLMAAATILVTVKEPVFDFLCSVMLLPIISSVTVILSFGYVFGGIVNTFSIVRQFVLLALTSVISFFGSVGFAHTAFTAVLTLNSFMLIYDTVSSIIFTNKKGTQK